MAGWVLPGAATVSEWRAPINGFIATCVEASTAVITGIYGVLSPTAGNTQRLAQDLIARGEAGRGGATNYLAAGAQLGRLGIPTQSYGASWIARHNPFTAINAALASGRPVLIGTTNSSALRDSITGARPDLGVQNHGLAIVGADAQSYLVADPNTAPGSGFMHYSPQNLTAAHLSSLTIPLRSAPAMTAASSSASPTSVFASIAGGVPQLGGSGVAAPSSGSGSSSSGSSNGSSPNPAMGAIFNLAPWLGGVGWVKNDPKVNADLSAFAIGMLLLGVGLVAFFFAGSGRTIVVEGAKTGAKAAVGAAVA